ncbi:hypothetical protein [Aeromonas veronii]
MTKAAITETEPNIRPLIPLEYCSPERASRLFKCEVDDIFHWVATGAINLFAEFSSYKIDSDHIELLSDCDWLEDSNSEGVISSYYGPDVNNGNNYRPSLHYLEPYDPSREHELRISGLWHVNYDSEFSLHVLSRMDGERRCILTAFFEPCKKSSDFKPSLTLYDVLVSDMPARLRIKRDDLLKIQRHINSGEVMNMQSLTPRTDKVNSVNESSGKMVSNIGRVTRKQCCFIVDLLRAHGLTDADFKGSIGELRQKIANKIPAIGSLDVDDNTLTDWLRKAGVR